MWTRGHREDFNEWAKLVGNTCWNYENLLPYFKRAETHYDGNLNPNQHGFTGPIHLSSGGKEFPLEGPLKETFESVGLKYNPDVNGGDPTGICPIVENWYQDKRQPAGLAYSLEGIHVITNCLV